MLERVLMDARRGLRETWTAWTKGARAREIGALLARLCMYPLRLGPGRVCRQCW